MLTDDSVADISTKTTADAITEARTWVACAGHTIDHMDDDRLAGDDRGIAVNLPCWHVSTSDRGQSVAGVVRRILISGHEALALVRLQGNIYDPDRPPDRDDVGRFLDDVMPRKHRLPSDPRPVIRKARRGTCEARESGILACRRWLESVGYPADDISDSTFEGPGLRVFIPAWLDRPLDRPNSVAAVVTEVRVGSGSYAGPLLLTAWDGIVRFFDWYYPRRIRPRKHALPIDDDLSTADPHP